MPIEKSTPKPEFLPPHLTIGLGVYDRDGNSLGKVRARFSRYFLTQRGSVFGKAYYVPYSAISGMANVISLSLTEADLRRMGLNSIPDDLYIESPELGVPDVSGVAQFARGPLSPAETGHYNYGRRSPGMNTDASGSYHREEVLPQPQKFVQEEIFATDLPIEPRDISSN